MSLCPVVLCPYLWSSKSCPWSEGIGNVNFETTVRLCGGDRWHVATPTLRRYRSWSPSGDTIYQNALSVKRVKPFISDQAQVQVWTAVRVHILFKSYPSHSLLLYMCIVVQGDWTERVWRLAGSLHDSQSQSSVLVASMKAMALSLSLYIYIYTYIHIKLIINDNHSNIDNHNTNTNVNLKRIRITGSIRKARRRAGVACAEVGKLNLSCDVTVVNHLSHRVIVFEWAHIKQQSPDWEAAQNHHITW